MAHKNIFKDYNNEAAVFDDNSLTITTNELEFLGKMMSDYPSSSKNTIYFHCSDEPMVASAQLNLLASDEILPKTRWYHIHTRKLYPRDIENVLRIIRHDNEISMPISSSREMDAEHYDKGGHVDRVIHLLFDLGKSNDYVYDHTPIGSTNGRWKDSVTRVISERQKTPDTLHGSQDYIDAHGPNPPFDTAAFAQRFRAALNEDIAALTEQFGVEKAAVLQSAAPALQNILRGTFSLVDLEAAVTERPISKIPRDAAVMAVEAFRTTSVLRHLDNFVVASQVLSPSKDGPDWQHFPNILKAGRYAALPLSLSDANRSLYKGSQAAPIKPFEDILDSTKGTHAIRLASALQAADDEMGAFLQVYRSIQAEVNQIFKKIEMADKNISELSKKVEKADILNAPYEAREAELNHMKNNAWRISEVRNDMNNERVALQVATTLSSMVLGDAAGATAGASGAAHNAGMFLRGNNPLLTLHNSRAMKKASKVEGQIWGEISDVLREKMTNVPLLNETIRVLQSNVDTHRQDIKRLGLDQDTTRRQAILDAFVNKSVLLFGERVTDALEGVCQAHGIEGIDELIAQYTAENPRLSHAIQHLAFGIADSNDLSILLAESAAKETSSNGWHRALAEFVDTMMRPNISEFYQQGSKVDLIYQSNLSGLGSKYNTGRGMIRDAHDKHVEALFADAFGVQSEMSTLTVRGALDVRNLFDFYMHRHGDEMMTDAKLRDGKITGDIVPKRVNILNKRDMDAHVNLTKTARGLRQSAPDINDMFLRACGSEYFYPQAPNDAQTSNIMEGNPEAPASYLMANRVLQGFMEKLSIPSIEQYRDKIGDKLDNVIAQSFFDFFSDLGKQHASDPQLGKKRADVKSSAIDGSSFGFAFDLYANQITKDALTKFDLFLNIYKANLQKQIEKCGTEDRTMLLSQIDAVAELAAGVLRPAIVKPGSPEALDRAYHVNHLHENTRWGSQEQER